MAGNSNHLQRTLKNRHIQMIALGGAIGTGLFIGVGASIKLAGPSIILSYLIGGLAVFFIMRALGEMAVDEPVSASFSHYAYKYWGDFAGFFSGWNYWFAYVVVGMAELAATAVYIQYWFPEMPQWLIALTFLVIITTVNCVNVKAFGEFEFWFAIIKVIAIIGVIVAGIFIVSMRLNCNGHIAGISNLWIYGGFFPNGLKGLLFSLVMVMFSFGGVEMIGIAAGEADNPKKTIPKAINQVAWRICIFYVGSITVIMSIFPWRHVSEHVSPFVDVFSEVGVPGASIMNVVLLTACLSAYNSGLYTNARSLYGLALQGNAPKAFAYINKSGVPIWGVLISSALSIVTVILMYINPGTNVFHQIATVATVCIVFNWILILITHMKFRKNLSAEKASKLEFKSPFFPISSYFSIILCIITIGLLIYMPDKTHYLYMVFAWAVVLWIGYKIMLINKRKKGKIHK